MSNDTKKTEPSDAQILARLRRAKSGRTAAQLGTTVNRLRALAGVAEGGRVQTGKAGRPAILFVADEQLSAVGGLPNNGEDPSAQSRDGSLSAVEA